MKGKDLEEDRRDGGDDYWKGTIRQRTAQRRQMWKQHAEALTIINCAT